MGFPLTPEEPNMQKIHQLSESQIPKTYYNIVPDLPFSLHPPLHPGTKQPIGSQDMTPIFPMALIEQEVSEMREIPIPEDVLEVYRLYRPTPLIRATELEAALDTPARIYYKYEGVSPVGSHKPNTAIAQVYYNKQEGTKKLVTETGAGQWGSALSFACQKFGLDCTVYMVKVSYDQKPYRRIMMEVYGAKVYPSPSERTEAGRQIIAANAQSPGSLGIAISEAIEEALREESTKYSLGSVLNHVLLHQTVLGQEVKTQLKELNEKPDVIIGCHGGGSNFAGLAFPFIRDKINGANIEIIAVEPLSCPTLTTGKLDYVFGDTSGMTPLLRMYTLGHQFIPPPIHAGGLRYHGASPIISSMKENGIIRAEALSQIDIFGGAIQFAKAEGIIPAPEPAHAVEMVIRQAKRAKEEGKEKVIVFNLCGHGLLDLRAYESYLQGTLEKEEEILGIE
jgi:tryptophan synthase beta chain